MKKLILMVGLLVTLPSFAGVSANVGITSDYIWRGMTQSDGISVSGGFDYEADNGFYAGVWGANINWGYATDDAGVLTDYGSGNEFDVYGGYANDNFDVGFIQYQYPGGTDLDFTEVYVGYTGLENFSIYYYDLATSDFESEFEDVVSDYLSLSYDLGSFSFSYGTYGDVGSDISISYSFSCGSFDCGLTYFDFSADEDAFDELEDNGVFFSISASL